MLNRLLQPKTQNRAAYVDSQGRISRTWVDTYAGVVVDVNTTLSVPAVWRAVTMISDDVGSLPIHAYRGERRLYPTPRILERPNPLETPMETYSAMAAALLLHGNYIALKGPTGLTGWPDYIVPVDPAKVEIVARDGRKFFRIDERTYTADEVFHIKGFTLPGEIAGVGIIAAQRQGIGAAIAVMEYAARYFDGGAMPSYAIKSENPDLTQEEAELLKQKWMEHYGGRSRIPAVLNATTDIKELTDNANDAQLVEARNQSILDAANIVGVPGAAVGAPNTSRTYTNTELQALEYIKTSLRPLTTRIEQAMTDLIPRGQTARFSFDAMLRADTLTRYQAHKIALDSGFLTVDEVRQIENREPLDDDSAGDIPDDPEDIDLDDDDQEPGDATAQVGPAFDMEDLNA
jgi:HK97 family phage portal protein